ncbi:hypothetical protein BKA67DRAFT_662455 [Truncatella angustata]|uniref:Nitrogen regulatory protein areA GATA-like domain-containing protein n=1 Tax=Truncatella angustata TaxID=152316 RepID=A0A9P8RKR2_9PEZI|nr:uncharacterized protein BKA67DRAFT_662455 [Truncatella angustata]KAH6647684.1 hypothetical protein BKA67DRAFT_662455 [Truncatella angustata]KAH8200608.1 hypothetical protein TruAng_005205 [Truncatella angustata]
MPSKTEGLVLTVDPHVLHKVDTENPENFFSIWALFSRCADSVEQGRRLENLSWRLWNREVQCCAAQTKEQESHATSFPKDIPSGYAPEMPQLSGSVDSAIDDDEDAVEFSSELEPVDILRPAIVRHDSCASSQSRGRERHITSDHLERMVCTIIQETEPNLNPLPEISSPSIEPESDESQSAFSPDTQEVLESPTTPATEPMCYSTGNAETDPSELASSANTYNTQVIRGFSPSQLPIPSLRIMSQEFMKASESTAIPEPQSSPAHKPVQLKKQPAKFALGGSSGDESSPSLEVRQPMIQQAKKKGMFSIGESSGSNGDETPSLKSAMHSARPSSLLNTQKKQASFSNQVTTRTIQTPSDQSDSYMDESAIDDDDEDSEWEDSIEESGKSSIDDPVTFKRVPSKPNLTSQRSLISLMFAGQDQRASGLNNHVSHSTSALPQRARSYHGGQASQAVASPNDSDDNGLEMNMRRNQRRAPLRPINEIPRSTAQPIMTTIQSNHQAALSPRTTRRNMLATELTESLRRHLLWERQHKSSTANAVLKRRHTSHDVANLKQYPEKSYMGKDNSQTITEEQNASSWNQVLERDALGGYNAQGW